MEHFHVGPVSGVWLVTRTIAVVNQKGGVGKTTTVVNLASEIARLDRRVLVIDCDPQASATSGLSVVREEGQDLYDVFVGDLPLDRILVPTPFDGVTVIPGSRDLVSLELELGRRPGRELILKGALARILPRFDYVLIDCPPSNGLLTLNALGAATEVLIPLQAEYYALEGLSQLMETLKFVGKTFNPALGIIGVLLTMYDGRTNLSAQIESEAREFFGEKVFSVKIPRNIRLSEAPSFGKPIRFYDRNSPGAHAYADAATELLNRIDKSLSGERLVGGLG